MKDASSKAKLSKLKQVSFFSQTPERELRQIASFVTERDYHAEEIIVEENSVAQTFFIIYRGKIQISKRFEDGEEFVLGVYSDGEFFGEMAILDEGPRSATARAVEPTSVLQVSYKDFEGLLRAAPQIAYAIMKELSARLRETGALLVWQLTRKNRELAEAYLDTVRSIVSAIEEHNPHFVEHSERVARLSVAIGRQMSLPDQDILGLELGGLLHDIGMIGVDPSLVHQPRRLTVQEREQLQLHTRRGKRMIEDVPYLSKAIPHVLYHHERYDGTGYPESLAGADIPLVSRIVAVADVFDALTHDRAQREALATNLALDSIKQRAGTEFDPDVVAALVSVAHDEAGPANGR